MCFPDMAAISKPLHDFPFLLWRLVTRYVEFGASVWRDLSPGWDKWDLQNILGSTILIEHHWTLVHWFKERYMGFSNTKHGCLKNCSPKTTVVSYCNLLILEWIFLVSVGPLCWGTPISEALLSCEDCNETYIPYPKNILWIKLVPEW